MTTRNTFEPLVSLTGLAALVVYVVACTSFSPDDSQVLYPTYDPQAQTFGLGLYDRSSAKATTLFTAQASPSDGSPGDAVLMRSQWFLDGGHILAAWMHDGEEDVLHLAVLPCGQAGTTRFIQIESLPEAGSQLARPLAVAESNLYLQGVSNTLVRVDLRSGHVERRSVPSKVMPYALPVPHRIGYLAEPDDAGQLGCEFGIVQDPGFNLVPLGRLKPGLDADELGRCGISPDGRWLVMTGETGDLAGRILLWEGGKEARRWQPFAEADAVKFGRLTIMAAPRTAFVPFAWQGAGETNAALGIIEVPLQGGELRRLTLVPRMRGGELERVLYFQPSVSHDGKTLAVASTYVAAGDAQIAWEDCALFLVDLADPQRKVTRVPVPRPPDELR